MKRIISLVSIIFVIFSQSAVFAKEADVFEYEVAYYTDCDTEVKPSTAKSAVQTASVAVTATIPQKDGYTFLGWSEVCDYNPDIIYKAKEKIEVSTDTVLYAVWEKTGAKKIFYKEDGQLILPSQVVTSDEAVLSKTIPQKDGYIFGGWENGGNKILLPNQTITVKKDITLSPVWHKGVLQKPDISVSENNENGVLFAGKNLSGFDNFDIVVKNLITNEEYHLGKRLLAKSLEPGQYQVYIKATKYGIEYKSESTNFVVQSPEKGDDTPLRLFMNGRELSFDMPPILLEGYTFIALRHFCESMGARVDWIDESRCALITYNGKIIKLFEDSNVCIINGETRFLPTKTKLLESRMFLPLRSVAEICDCEIVWDVGRRVYVYKDEAQALSKNMFFIKNSSGEFLSYNDAELKLSSDESMNGIWIFDEIDKENQIYEIYNLADLERPLEVKRSEVFDGQSVRIWEKSGYDGSLWKIKRTQNGEYMISPKGNDSLYLDTDTMTLTNTEKGVIFETANY